MRHERLLAVALAVERRVAAPPARVAGGDGRDGGEHLLVDRELGVRDLRDGRDRAVVVRRPEAARGDDEIVGRELAQALRDLVVTVADDAHALQLDAERVELVGEEARVGVGHEAEEQLLPGDEQRGRRPARRHVPSVASGWAGILPVATCGLVVSAVNSHGPVPVRAKERPLTNTETFPGMAVWIAKPY